jgi:hypothetical protein
MFIVSGGWCCLFIVTHLTQLTHLTDNLRNSPHSLTKLRVI